MWRSGRSGIIQLLSKSQVSITKKQTIANNQLQINQNVWVLRIGTCLKLNLELGTFTFTHLCVRKAPRSGTPTRTTSLRAFG